MFNLIPKAYAAIGIRNLAIPGSDKPDASQATSFANYFGILWQTLIIVGGLAFLLYLLLGGINWITAGGDKGKIEESKTRITQGFVGLAVLSASYVIVKFIETALGLTLLNIIWPTAN